MIKRMLEDEIKSLMEEAGSMDINDEEYRKTMKLVCELTDRLNRLENIDFEINKEENNYELGLKRAEQEDKKLKLERDKDIRNVRLKSIGLGCAVGLTLGSFLFEKTDGFSTQATKNIVQTMSKKVTDFMKF